jgi:predicted porin
MGGFKARAAYKFGETVQVLPAPAVPTKSAANAYSLSATYANGPVLLTIANYESTQAAGTYAANSKKKDMVFGGTYNFGVAKVAAQVFSEKGTLAALTSYSTRTTEIGVTVPVAAWNFRAMYARYNDRASATNLDATAIGLGADYALSKRSTLYARYSKISNSTNATMAIGGGLQGGTGNITAGSSPSAITAGLNLKF